MKGLFDILQEIEYKMYTGNLNIYHHAGFRN